MLRNLHTTTDETELKPELTKLTALGNAILHFDKIEKDHGLDLKWRDSTGSLLRYPSANTRGKQPKNDPVGRGKL
ncbi:hypothetical protein Peur_034544 [Populus x canadensis]